MDSNKRTSISDPLTDERRAAEPSIVGLPRMSMDEGKRPPSQIPTTTSSGAVVRSLIEDLGNIDATHVPTHDMSTTGSSAPPLYQPPTRPQSSAAPEYGRHQSTPSWPDLSSWGSLPGSFQRTYPSASRINPPPKNFGVQDVTSHKERAQAQERKKQRLSSVDERSAFVDERPRRGRVSEFDIPKSLQDLLICKHFSPFSQHFPRQNPLTHHCSQLQSPARKPQPKHG